MARGNIEVNVINGVTYYSVCVNVCKHDIPYDYMWHTMILVNLIDKLFI